MNAETVRTSAETQVSRPPSAQNPPAGRGSLFLGLVERLLLLHRVRLGRFHAREYP